MTINQFLKLKQSEPVILNSNYKQLKKYDIIYFDRQIKNVYNPPINWVTDKPIYFTKDRKYINFDFNIINHIDTIELPNQIVCNVDVPGFTKYKIYQSNNILSESIEVFDDNNKKQYITIIHLIKEYFIPIQKYRDMKIKRIIG